MPLQLYVAWMPLWIQNRKRCHYLGGGCAPCCAPLLCSSCVARAKSPPSRERRENGPPWSFVLHPWTHEFTKANHPKKASFFYMQRMTRSSKANLARNMKRRDEYVPCTKINFKRNALACRFPCVLQDDEIGSLARETIYHIILILLYNTKQKQGTRSNSCLPR